jgi:hypothetical protein
VSTDNRIPIMTGLRCLELASPERARRIAHGANVRLVRRRRSHQVVEIQLVEHGNDDREPAKMGNPLVYSHDNETDRNPGGCWTLKHQGYRPAFMRVVQDCLKAA